MPSLMPLEHNNALAHIDPSNNATYNAISNNITNTPIKNMPSNATPIITHTSSHPITVIIIHADSVNGLGDNVIALPMLLAIKKAYNARLIVFARDVLAVLTEHFYTNDKKPIIDAYHMLEGALESPSNLARINAYHAHFLLTLSCKRHQINTLKHTNANTIITRAKLATIYSPRFKSLFLRPHITHRNTLLLLARLINKRIFDEVLPTINFLESSINTSKQEAPMCAFFTKELARFKRNDYIYSTPKAPSTITQAINHIDIAPTHIASPITNATPPTHHMAPPHHTRSSYTLSLHDIKHPPHIALPPRNLSLSSTPLFLIGINPFSISTIYQMHLISYLRLMHQISLLPHCIPCVCTYNATHKPFLRAINDYNTTYNISLHKHIIIYHNAKGLTHLASFLSHLSLLITPNTGTLHLADNLFIPSIALPGNSKRWRAQYGLEIPISSPFTHITQAEEEIIINSILRTLCNMLDLHSATISPPHKKA